MAAAEIFISYARADRKRVALIAEALIAAGYTVWWDNDLRSGGSFQDQIEEALDSASIAIVCWSAASVGKGDVKSRWVRSEAERAAQTPNKLIPVLLEGDPPLGFASIHALDLRKWDAFNVSDKRLDALVDRVREQLGARTNARKRTNAWKRARQISDAVLATLTTGGLAAAVGWLFQHGSHLVASEAIIALAGLAFLALMMGVFAAGALLGVGYRGAGRWVRPTIGAGLALAAASLPLWALPELNPGDLQPAPLLEFELRQTVGREGQLRGATPITLEDVANSNPGLIAKLQLHHGASKQRASANIQILTATLLIDRDAVPFLPNQFMEVTAGAGEAGPWLPNAGLIAIPYRHGPETPAEILFVNDTLTWRELVSKLKRPASNIEAKLELVMDGAQRSTSCRGLVRRSQDFIDQKLNSGTLPNILYFPCEDLR